MIKIIEHWIFLYPQYDLDLSPVFFSYPPLIKPYQHKHFYKDVCNSFGVITNTGKQTNENNHKHNLLDEVTMNIDMDKLYYFLFIFICSVNILYC